jgi:hypothetical protein
VSILKRTHWVHFDQISGYFMKELNNFFHDVSTGHCGGYFVKEPKGFI